MQNLKSKFLMIILIMISVIDSLQAQTTVYNWSNAIFGADATQAKQYTIGRVYYNDTHWGGYGSMRIRISSYYYKSAFAEYIILGNPGTYGQTPEIICVSSKGYLSQSVQLNLGAANSAGSTYSGGNNYYKNILLDADYYTLWNVEVEATCSSFAIDKTSIASGEYTFMTVFSSPASTNISSFTSIKDISFPSDYGKLLIPINTNIMGNVGIGTTSPNEKLSVNGNISSKKSIVTQTGWSDYVFNDDYKLRPLNEVEKFVQENKHLPEVPSAKEVEDKGLDLGANQAVLLKKIEELTLYMIKQEKKIKGLISQVDQQQRQISSLTKRISNEK